MENLSDEEFGTKSVEEAPILIAQRYLNIFRQVHIFNKNTRDKFDDELLALPENIIGFIKKMPGGRLLIEHIEGVKTERGISFVKTNRDEFTNDGSVPAGAPNAMVPMHGGGNVVMDASFAETLAKSLASAFKHVPAASGGTNFAAPADMGQAFELIAEEIRASHSSLLDVLKETRNITDSVIASQVSISRILEGILSSRTPDGNNSDVNNQIVASQASITKLLESLYNSNVQKEEKLDKYFDVEDRLSRFENEMRNEIRSLLANNAANVSAQNIEPQIRFVPQVEKTTNEPVQNFESNKKKKNKNKNKGKSAGFNVAAAPLAAAEQNLGTDFSDFAVENDTPQPINGVIRNSAYKHEDDFSNVNLNEPPLEDIVTDNTFGSEVSLPKEDEEPTDILSDLDNLDDFDLSSVEGDLPQTEEANTDDEALNLDNLVPEEEPQEDLSSLTEEPQEDLSSLAEEAPAEDVSEELSTDDNLNLDSFATDDLSVDLSDTTENEEVSEDTSSDTLDEPEIPSADDIGLDALAKDLDENFEDNIEEDTEETENATSEALPDVEELDTDTSLDEFASDDETEEVLPSENDYETAEEDLSNLETEEQEQPSRYSDTLDKIRDALTSDNIDISSLDEPIALDDYSDDENVSEEDTTPTKKEAPADNNDEEWEYEYVEDDGSNGEEETTSENGEDWEYEYVDENGNVVTSKGDNQEGEDWEWEYVDEDQADSSDNNNPQ